MSDKANEAFQHAVRDYYMTHGRHELPWRQPEPDGRFDPYKILVSEVMLQQTQVNRVISKYQEFLARFPDVKSLADAELGEVLIAWQGLGYNRRAKFLWQAARHIAEECRGVWPRTAEGLVALPGVGNNTAGALLAYAFNQPAVFVETNVRTVYFHHFFRQASGVSDKELRNVIALTIDHDNPREFYWAVMDYGTYLKRQGHGNLTRSKHYAKQSRFAGSKRQVRGRVLRLLANGPASRAELLNELADARAQEVLDDLVREELVRYAGEQYRLA